jgi:hypothetical protein
VEDSQLPILVEVGTSHDEEAMKAKLHREFLELIDMLVICNEDLENTVDIPSQ